MATMEDIAKKLCISKGTVSKALSGAPDVSETMRKTILETAVELGYQRGLRRDEAMRLAVAHLQGLGHCRIGYLSGFLGSFINQQRYDAFFQALRAHGLPHEESQGGIPISTILLHARLVERQSTAPPGLRP